MRCSPRSLLWDNLLLCLGLLLFHCVLVSGEDRVLTEAQAGPLYRVEGSQLSISCRVTGLTPPPGDRNNFNILVKKPSNPNFELHIISTKDKDFPYASYRGRVNTDKIMVEHVDLYSVVFKIQSLEKEDEGDYECAVINTRATYLGTYSAFTTVKVIDNSLSVSSSAPTSLTKTEGDALALTCEVSTTTIQHTHLSFAWFLRKNGEDDGRLLISMDREFTLIPGQGFEERYKAGLIRLDKIGEVTYRLKMSQLELSDQGELYCEAQEWIQDPDRTWYPIANKTAEKTNLTVKAKEVLIDSASLVVTISAPQSTLQEGQLLALSCTVHTQDLKEKFFSLSWLHDGVELARIGPTGVLAVGLDYASRQKQGELRAAKTGDGDYLLILQPVRTSDQGEYICRAWPQDRSQTGVFTQGAPKDSGSQIVTISATESGLSVEMTNSVSVKEGGNLELSCRVSGVTGQLSVTWQRKSTSPSDPFTSLISLSQDGVMTKAEGGIDVKVKALRPTPHLFTLELKEATQSDAGVYQCVVSEWKTNSKDSSRLGTTNVNVTPLESFVKVFLINRNQGAEEGQKVEIICRVKGLSLPRTLTWSFRRDSSTPDNILTLYSSGAISWFGDQHRYQLKIDDKTKQLNEMWYYLIIDRASKREDGNYQCSVSVVLGNAPRKVPPSNDLAVRVVSPESNLQLNKRATALNVKEGSDVELECSLISVVNGSSFFYKVIWLYSGQNTSITNVPLVELDHMGLLKYPANQDVHGLQERLRLLRPTQSSFHLGIKTVHEEDSGSYVCQVEQYQLDRGGQWQQKASNKTGPIPLNVTVTGNNLSIVNTDMEFNISTSQSLTIPCNITAQSSPQSEFQVTWFWQNDADNQHPIFTAYRNSTLQYWFGKSDEQLRFAHPLPNQFSLTLLKSNPADSGRYFCEVEDWVPSLSHGWRKVGVERSGYLTASVHTEGRVGGVSGPVCNSPTWIGAFVGITLLLLLVIVLLVLRMCRKNGKKKEESLWTENHQLNPKD